MTVNHEELATRVERLERILGEDAMDPDTSPRRDDGVHRFWRRIPFGAWLKISGPTFAVMALGFGLLWGAQQETPRRILAVQESTAAKIAAVGRATSDQILASQERMTDRILASQDAMSEEILASQRETMDRILEVERTITDRSLELQQQIMELHRDADDERG